MYHTGGEKMSDVNKTIGEEAIYDAKSLGTSKMLILGAQHMFAMFGATVLVPVLTGLPVAATLLFAGLGIIVCRFGNLVIPFPCKRKSSCIFGFVLCIFGRLLGNRT